MKKTQKLAGIALGTACALWTVGLPLMKTPTIPVAVAAERGAAQPLIVKSSAAKDVRWRTSLAAALKEAKTSGKPVMIDFFATWCGPCQFLDEAYKQPAVAAELRKWITVKIDTDKNEADSRTYKAEALPTLVFLAPNGREVGRKVGVLGPNAPRVKTKAEFVNLIAKDVISLLHQHEAKIRNQKSGGKSKRRA